MKRRKVVVTENFERNLDGLEAFRADHPGGFQRALERLYGDVLPLLRKQAHLGRLHRTGQPIVERIRLRLGGGVLREVLVEEYVMLYLAGDDGLVLLSIRHQRELDFDFGD
ncbi:MAG: hypothetical protein Q8N23_15830 [Archangium sp.]|nr:hypothetical protein [Archangium sp.]MDP3154145.1 hypothetical protein [Archangium sp.]MDP3569484.1 hypothetical protein [Archangium sp.]